MPADFAYDGEHPILPVPFTLTLGETRLQGSALSVAQAFVMIAGALDPRWEHHRAPARLQFDFDGFSIQVTADVMIVGSRRPGEMTLQFVDPLGAHLPQLRHILNSYISGDLVTLGGFLSYTGPTRPKSAKPAEGSAFRRRLRSLSVAMLSLMLIVSAAVLMLNRAAVSHELRPVFISLDGREMRATAAGQVSYLNPDARQGEVVFSINSNAGDVLNFQLPCDCRVEVVDGIYQGATVLPIDAILSIFDENAGVRVQTQISIEGLTRVMSGATAYLDINGGRSVPVRVQTSLATTMAAERGDLFVPVDLVAAEGALGPADLGASARLRIVSPWLTNLFFSTDGTST